MYSPLINLQDDTPMINRAVLLKENAVLECLNRKPYMHIPFPVPKDVIRQAMDCFFAFLNLPDDIKHHIDFKIASMHRRGDVGFKHRNPEKDIYNDHKDFFHFHPLIFDRYNSFLKDQPIVQRFMQNAQIIWKAAFDSIDQILSSLELDFPGTHTKVFDTDEVHIILRFLKYSWTESGKYLAKPHYDAGSFTLAIAESCSGLRIGTGPTDLETVDHKEDHAIFMVSSNFKKIIDTDALIPGWHDVIQRDESFIGKNFARWAVVAFIEGHSVEALSRQETHKFYTSE